MFTFRLKGHKVEKRAGASHLQGKSEKVGTVQPGEDCMKTTEQYFSIRRDL